MGSIGQWSALAQKCIDIKRNSLPAQWTLPVDKLAAKSSEDITSLPQTSGILSDLELQITEQDAEGILQKYLSGDWTLNFATEFLSNEALKRADELDEYFARTGKLAGPLHGIPMSIKEHLEVAGKITHAGFVSKISHVSDEDALIIKLLKDAGAVLHVRTNQPQSLMHLDCDNNITGRTLNPYNLRLTPGGSSGGEGASIGFRASVIGVGTDIGGSIRVPAAFNNCYGLRPTTLRNSNLGLYGINAGQESIRGVAGPLGQSLNDLELFQKALLDQQPWDIDTTLIPVPWRDVELPTNFTVGVMMDDGIVKPHPPVLRALESTSKRLRAACINVVPWEPFDHKHGWDIVAALYFPDGGEGYRAEFDKTGEPELPLTTWAIQYSRKQPLSVRENWSLNASREAYRRAHHQLMKERGVDVILCPAYPGAGALQGTPKYWNYTAIWNILDQPAVVMPSGLRCDRSLDKFDDEYVARSEEDEREWQAYDPDLFHDFPVALQVVGKHWQDETLLKAAKKIEKAIRA
ncbi:fatty-acid amide hydrolase [Hortaea werneckii]|uniref:amidase n=1 Tax=Hortaea werneckii TaxID=91943 RepID=A0A3M7D5K7_HORWE|nr:fatty-acid amide hydrolase [Hortaea werneckii]KAI7718895.1 fatty-acid amide hydrolase [Hortaea werneckii]RMY59559.1 hypothetical protein D0865_02014 [Hortaea werneckii]